MISVRCKGSFSNTEKLFQRMLNFSKNSKFDKYGEMGIEALAENTPKDTGLTASSWKYRVNFKKDYITIEWYNENIQNDVIIAVLLQYGHATEWGGYVEGQDYINPAMRPIFQEIANDAWKEVIST